MRSLGVADAFGRALAHGDLAGGLRELGSHLKDPWVDQTELGQNVYSSGWATWTQLEAAEDRVKQPAPATPPTAPGPPTSAAPAPTPTGATPFLPPSGPGGAAVAVPPGSNPEVTVPGASTPLAPAGAGPASFAQVFSGFGGGEQKLTVNLAGRNFWEICNELANSIPGYIAAAHPFGVFRSTLFWGRPHWPVSYRYLQRFKVAHSEAKIALHDTGGLLREIAERDGKLGTRWGTARIARGASLDFLEVAKVFSQCHLAHDELDLISCELKADRSEVYTRARTYGLDSEGNWIQSGFLSGLRPGEQVLTVSVDPDIYPEEQRDMDIAVPFEWKMGSSTYATEVARIYAQSRLAESLRKMYDGHVVLHGNGNVKPWDLVRIFDGHNAIAGVCCVRAVTHHLGMDTGFVTDVTPGAVAWGATAAANLRAAMGAAAISGVLAARYSVYGALGRQRQAIGKMGLAVVLKAEQALDSVRAIPDPPEGEATRLSAAMAILGEERVALAAAASALGSARTFEELDQVLVRLRSICLNVAGTLRHNETLLWSVRAGYADLELITRELTATADRVVRFQGHVADARSGDVGSLPGRVRSLNAKIAREIRGLRAAAKRRGSEGGLAATEPDDIFGACGVAIMGTAVTPLVTLMSGAIPIVGKGAAYFSDKYIDGVNVMLLSRAGREIQAGLTGHRGMVVGEAGGAMQQCLEGLGDTFVGRMFGFHR
jgi:hypothetical protein